MIQLPYFIRCSKLSQGFGPVLGLMVSRTVLIVWIFCKSSQFRPSRVGLGQSASRGKPVGEIIYGSANDVLIPGGISQIRKHLPISVPLALMVRKIDQYNRPSLRSKPETNLGNFRWIAWHVSPVSKLNENTAFQELAVEIGVKKDSGRQFKVEHLNPRSF